MISMNDIMTIFCINISLLTGRNIKNTTERGGSVVTHEARIREVPGSNPGADQPGCGFFRGFPQSSRQTLGWIFITAIHLTIIHQIHKS